MKECETIQADIVAINDASTDRSVEILKQYGIVTLSHGTQMGYGVTVQTGYKYAHRNHYDYVIQVDGDGQHDSRCIALILKQTKNPNRRISLLAPVFSIKRAFRLRRRRLSITALQCGG